MAIILSFLSAQVTTTFFYGQSFGSVRALLPDLLRPEDVFWSFVQAVIISVIVMINHCYFGYFASGGPVGRRRGRGPVNAHLIGCDRLRGPVRIVGAVSASDPNFNLTV